MNRFLFAQSTGRRLGLSCRSFLAWSLAATHVAAAAVGNLSPSAALAAFATEPGFSVELVAAEPLTIDPVAVAFDEAGRLFVAEDRDYPLGSPDGRALGIIALLEDTDGDGRMDKRTDFATGLKFPNGVMPWRGGVIVTASPEVFWLADTNGDGRADVKEILLTGFATDSTSQLRANDPTLGPDGWVYLAGGLRGGKVYSPKRPAVIFDTSKGDLRFKPDTGEMELFEGKSQFGLAFDDAGNRFACMNRIQSQHAPLPAHYLARNPRVASPGALQNCPDFADNNFMTRYTAGASRYYPISENITTADSHYGTYSAACAVHIYRGTFLPREYLGAAFSCDPTGNLVRGDRLEKAGGTFAARRIHEGTEALRSRDNWFRPVFLADGPDGALYIADMYRKVIEHPEYLPGDVRKHMDFEAGKDQGRIWRLRGSGAGDKSSGSQSRATLARAKSAELVSALNSSIPWRRDTAFRLLVERHETNMVPTLKRGFARARETGPAVAELQLIQLFDALDDAILERALRHPLPGVRQNALRLAEPRLAADGSLRERALALASDADPHVRFQAALSLGGLSATNIVPALARIAAVQANDRWTRAAILSSLRGRDTTLSLLAELAKQGSSSNSGIPALATDLGRLLAAEDAAALLPQILSATANPGGDFQLAAVLGFAEGSAGPFRELARSETATLQPLLAGARRLAADNHAETVRRVMAARMLAHDDSAEAEAALFPLLTATEAMDLQVAAARALLQPERAAAASRLLAVEAWNRHPPALRTVLLNLMSGRAEFAPVLLDALESGSVPIGALTPAQRDQLRKSKQPPVRTRAEKLFAAPAGSREAAFAAAKAALALPPNPANGRAVFGKNCASCHRLNREGVAVGPDLFDIRNQTKEAILFHIIVPEAEIAPNFVNYECETKDGRVLAGLLAVESAGGITLRMAQGLEEVIPRGQISRLSASRLSLMPQEFEKLMPLQELADLLAYLRGEE